MHWTCSVALPQVVNNWPHKQWKQILHWGDPGHRRLYLYKTLVTLQQAMVFLVVAHLLYVIFFYMQLKIMFLKYSTLKTFLYMEIRVIVVSWSLHKYYLTVLIKISILIIWYLTILNTVQGVALLYFTHIHTYWWASNWHLRIHQLIQEAIGLKSHRVDCDEQSHNCHQRWQLQSHGEEPWHTTSQRRAWESRNTIIRVYIDMKLSQIWNITYFAMLRTRYFD